MSYDDAGRQIASTSKEVRVLLYPERTGAFSVLSAAVFADVDSTSVSFSWDAP